MLCFLSCSLGLAAATDDITVTEGAAGESSFFSFTGTFDTGPYSVGYVWTWGDGTADTTTTTPTTSHVYTTPGVYAVTLNIYGSLLPGGWDVAPEWDTTFGTYYATVTVTQTLTIVQPFNRTYSSGNIPILVSSNADLVYYNVYNGSTWMYVNTTYTGATTLTGLPDGSYMFYAAATTGNLTTTQNINFTVGYGPFSALPALNTDAFWLFYYEGDFLGAFQAAFIATFVSVDAAVAVIIMLFMLPLYLRTKSLLLLSIVWILIGSFLIVAVPLASGVAVLFIILAVGGLFWRLFKGGN